MGVTKISRKIKNCLLIVVDCLRHDKCNDPRIETRTIDFLMDRGTSFFQTIAATSTTTPSFASILTGLYPPAHGLRSLSGFKLKKSVENLPEILGEQGYTNYAEVSGPLLPELGLDRGFDEYNCRDPDQGVDSSWFRDLVKTFGSEDLEEPWFMLLHLFDLHRSQGERVPEENSRVKGRNRYERILSYLDFRLRELIDNLDFEDTMVVFTADHGQRIEEGLIDNLVQKAKTANRKIKKALGLEAPRTNPSIGHGFHVYDPLVRIPLIFVGEGLFPEGKKVSSQVRQIDISPTVLDVLGFEFGDEVHGASVLNLLEGENDERLAYMEACGAILEDKKYWRAGVRSEEYKHVWAPHNGDIDDELYDMRKDPEENNNIFKERFTVARALRKYGNRIRKEGEI